MKVSYFSSDPKLCALLTVTRSSLLGDNFPLKKIAIKIVFFIFEGNNLLLPGGGPGPQRAWSAPRGGVILAGVCLGVRGNEAGSLLPQLVSHHHAGRVKRTAFVGCKEDCCDFYEVRRNKGILRDLMKKILEERTNLV